MSELKVEWFPNGLIKREYYVTGKAWIHHGSDKEWYNNGQLRFENHYIVGVLVGLQRGWHDNSQLKYEEYYDNGRNGLCKRWQRDGTLEYKRYYNNGKSVSEEEYFVSAFVW